MKTLFALTSFLVASSFAPQSSRQEVPVAETSASKAIVAVEQAARAVQAWREELESGRALEPSDVRRLQQQVGELQRQAGAVLARLPKPDDTARAVQEAAFAMQRRAHALAQKQIDDMRALGADAPQRRERALSIVREQLTSGDEISQWAALMTLQSAGDIEYDKAPFRPLVLPFAREATGPMLVNAFYALWNTAHEDGDLALVHQAWTRDGVALRDSVLHLMFMFGDGRLEGRSEEIALEFLERYDGGNAGINGMWGARVGPKLEARVLELAKEPRTRHGAIYFGLSTLQDKSEAVVDALIAALADPDANNWDRALWGLGHGVPERWQPKVVEALVELHNSRSDRSARDQCRHILRQYGGEEALARLAK